LFGLFFLLRLLESSMIKHIILG